jgi:hypothetical protein
MLISRILNICNNDSNTLLLVSKMLSCCDSNDITNLFDQLEQYNIVGNKLYIVWKNECNNDYNVFLNLDFSQFNDVYFMNNQMATLAI